MRTHHLSRGADILRLSVVIALLLFLAACNPSHHSTDTDTIAPDIETSIAEDDLVVVDDSSDEDSILIDDTAVPDKDINGLVASCLADPEGTEYITNTHTGNEECPDLSAAEFPYYDTDGKIHFCRKCDKVWENDPRCVRNLWKEQNCDLCTAMPDYDCCGYPCTMEKLTPFYKDEREGYYLDECDMMLNPNNPQGWMSGMATFKHFNLSEGKAGMVMEHVSSEVNDNPVNFKAVVFDLTTRKYRVIQMGSGNDTLSYYKGTVLGATATISKEDKNEYLIYRDSTNNSFSVAYPGKVRSISYNPVINETWAFANIVEKDGDATKMMYAKVGEWQWTSLGEGVGNDPNIVGNILALYTDFKGYLCDLSKSPKALTECAIVNRGDEQVRHLILDRDNERIAYFNPTTMLDGFVRVDLSGQTPVYEKISVDNLQPNMYSIAIHDVRGSLILYANIFTTEQSVEKGRGNQICYYNLNKQKSYCSLPTPHKDGVLEYRQAYAEFENHWLVWQDSISPLMKARDMECYCDRHTDLCPFDDYTPQPDNPKDVKTGERPNGKKR